MKERRFNEAFKTITSQVSLGITSHVSFSRVSLGRFKFELSSSTIWYLPVRPSDVLKSPSDKIDILNVDGHHGGNDGRRLRRERV